MSPRRILLTALVATTLLLLPLGWVGLRAWQTRTYLGNSVSLAHQLSAQLVAGDVEQARRTLDALQRQTAGARSAAGDPVWRTGEHTPYAGANLAAVRAVTTAVDDLARNVFPDLLATPLTALMPRSGRIDLAALGQAAPRLTAADTALRRVRAGFHPPDAALTDTVSTAVRQLRDTLDTAARFTTAASRVGSVLPALLGAGGTRTYLAAFQNLAEARATGGMMGAFAILRVRDGRIELTGQGTASGMTVNRPGDTGEQRWADRLDPGLSSLYGELPTRYAADVNLTPDFPTAAGLYREMYHRYSGRWVDGVLATDPVALSYLLAATGPVPVPGGPPLTSATAVRSLLSDVYLRVPDPTAQDAYFARSVRAVFTALLARPLDARTLVLAADRALDERRLLFWSAHPAEQAVFARYRVAGALSDEETRPTVGVFLNDGSGAKLDYYLTRAASLTPAACRPDGRRELSVRVTLGSTAPRSGLTGAVLGMGMSGHPYTSRTLVAVYSPAGGSVVSAVLDGRRVAVGIGRQGRREVWVAVVDLRPGQSRTLRLTVLAPPTAVGAPDLWLTPGVTPWTTSTSSEPSCNQ